MWDIRPGYVLNIADIPIIRKYSLPYWKYSNASK